MIKKDKGLSISLLILWRLNKKLSHQKAGERIKNEENLYKSIILNFAIISKSYTQ